MSGIYIPGMEMPTSCYVCPFCDYVSARCDAVKGTPYTPTNRYEERADWCPLVPVPPHGRLIDVKSLENMHFTESMYDAESKLFVPFVEVASAIFDAPTIIQAEEGER